MKRRIRASENQEDDDNGFAAWGGYMEAKKSKLLEQYKNSTCKENSETDLFKGISIFVNGYTSPTADELKHIMSLHGGIYHHYHIPSKTSFIIASNLPDTKIKQMGPNQKIVKPEWITESIKANKLLDYSNFLLYTNHNRQQPKLNFEKLTKELKSNGTVKNETISEELSLSPDMFGSYENNIEKEQELKTDNLLNSNNKQKENLENKTTNISNIGKQSTRTLNANNPNFLSEFYNNSRLHHIATLGANFKQYICDLRDESKFIFPERMKLREFISSSTDNSNLFLSKKDTIIMHIDMDCFFVSVGLRNRPDLRGVPVAVTHSKGGQEPSLRSGVDRQAELEVYKQRIQDKFKTKELGPGNMSIRLEGIENQSMSEIASCSYEARKAGVKNGMFMGTALKLCPNLQTIPYDFSGYKEVAYTLYNTIAEYTLNIEAVSCDEMFVDITELLNDTKASVEQWATYIRSLIQKRTGCPCSTGFGANRLQARMATRTAKPNGQFHLIPEIVEEYMMNFKVDDLPGVGYSTKLKLESFNVKTCGDLQSMSIAKLRSEFGSKIGETLYNNCRGLDDKPLVYEHERKSVSAEVNYGIRFKNNTEAETFLRQVATEVHSRLTEVKMKGKCITLKLMVRSKDAPVESSKFMGHGICDNVTKSVTLSAATSDLDIIIREILSISQKLSIPPTELRGIGIQISRLEKLKKYNAAENLSKLINNMSTINKKSKEDSSIQNNNKNELHINNLTSSTNTLTKNNVSPEKIKQNNFDLQTNQNNIITENKEIAKSKPEYNQLNISKRGRGRPRGARGGKTIERKRSNNGNISKFLNSDNIPSTSTSNVSTAQPLPHSIPFSDIDLDVFSELPLEIQKEILAQYQCTAKSKNNSNNKNEISKISVSENIATNSKKINIPTNHVSEINGINSDVKNYKSPNIDSTCKSKKTEVENNKNKSMFSGMDTKQIKNIVRDWVLSVNSPELCDVKLLGEYFKNLALEKDIYDLFMMLKFLYSEILFKNSCGWHRSYFEVVESAQEGMMAKYGKPMKVYKDFKCKNECHLSVR